MVAQEEKIAPTESAEPTAAPEEKLLEEIADTRWQLWEQGRSVDVVFWESGIAQRVGTPGDREHGRWTLQRGVVKFSFVEDGPEYTGWLTRDGEILGAAAGGGSSWVWRLKLSSGAAARQAEPEQPKRVVRRQAPQLKRAAAPPLVGSRWLITYSQTMGPDFAKPGEEYLIELLPNGKLINHRSSNEVRTNDEWELDGEVIRLYFNKRYATYQGCVLGGVEIEGAAWNVKGKRWLWSMRRVHDDDKSVEADKVRAVKTTKPKGSGSR